ncbi:unnamed protein product [Gongylonema pulchrum]|uniref:DNA-directed DNA polymerase n=1 Tax=Gongylonema pulchrum TaxID=637853 RepID=A0A3P6Q938_9BILA|nr:unnamed protein product [Gongylonema pulchrum]
MLSADYRQLEMRVLAHLSEDAKLISLLQKEGDFFQTVTDAWNASSAVLNEVDRNKVKQLCYGILYGMGAASLAKQLSMEKHEAQQLISSFFQQFPKVRAWIDKTLKACHQDGFVCTLLGRRRYLACITSELQTERAQAERQAVNFCIQVDLHSGVLCLITELR